MTAIQIFCQHETRRSRDSLAQARTKVGHVAEVKVRLSMSCSRPSHQLTKDSLLRDDKSDGAGILFRSGLTIIVESLTSHRFTIRGSRCLRVTDIIAKRCGKLRYLTR
jgi:hypothetical protein